MTPPARTCRRAGTPCYVAARAVSGSEPQAELQRARAEGFNLNSRYLLGTHAVYALHDLHSWVAYMHDVRRPALKGFGF